MPPRPPRHPAAAPRARLATRAPDDSALPRALPTGTGLPPVLIRPTRTAPRDPDHRSAPHRTVTPADPRPTPGARRPRDRTR